VLGVSAAGSRFGLPDYLCERSRLAATIQSSVANPQTHMYFDTNRLIRDTFARAGFPVLEQHYAVRGSEALRLAQTA